MHKRTILDIYKRYIIPPNLIRHQLEVAAVGRVVSRQWVGLSVDIDLITQTLLLHDMGNIIKFKRPFMGELEKEAVYWEKVQEEYRQKYGPDVHEATMIIVRELGLPMVAKAIEDMRSVWSEPAEVLPFEARICEYADCCVTPQGITSFENRIEDLKQRYSYTDDSPAVKAARKNASVVVQHTSLSLGDASRLNFSKEIIALQSYIL